MDTIKASELPRQAAEVLQTVRTGGSVTITHYGKPIARIIPYTEAPMTAIPESLEPAVSSFAERENITMEEAAGRLIRYGLNDVAENDRFLESLDPLPYRVESCESYVDNEGETALTDYVESVALPTLPAARKALCGIVEADADAKASIENAPLGHALALKGSYYRITKSS
jgi:prevent-host-death family protein